MRYLLLRSTALACLIVTFSLACLAAETGAQYLDSSWIKAMRANDLEAVLKTYAPDAVVWLPQIKEARGEKTIRATFEGLLSANTVKEVVLSETEYRTMGKVSVG
jgi:ketosteroid isomerase-like protein